MRPLLMFCLIMQLLVVSTEHAAFGCASMGRATFGYVLIGHAVGGYVSFGYAAHVHAHWTIVVCWIRTECHVA